MERVEGGTLYLWDESPTGLVQGRFIEGWERHHFALHKVHNRRDTGSCTLLVTRPGKRAVWYGGWLFVSCWICGDEALDTIPHLFCVVHIRCLG